MRKQTLLTFLLLKLIALLGITGCGKIFPKMYGMPTETSHFLLRGTVTTPSGESIKDIKVDLKVSRDNKPFIEEVLRTTQHGKVDYRRWLYDRELSEEDLVTITLQDTDGEMNLGKFKTKTITGHPTVSEEISFTFDEILEKDN